MRERRERRGGWLQSPNEGKPAIPGGLEASSVIPHAAQVTAYYRTLPPLSTLWEIPAVPQLFSNVGHCLGCAFSLPALGPFKLGHCVENEGRSLAMMDL